MDRRHINGAAAELYVASVLAEKGYGVFYPLVTQSRCDLVIETPDGFKKVQVKKATQSRAGKFQYLQARLTSRSKETAKPYTKEDVDYFAFTDMLKVWLAPFDEIGNQTSVCLGSTNPTYKPQTTYDANSWLMETH